MQEDAAARDTILLSRPPYTCRPPSFRHCLWELPSLQDTCLLCALPSVSNWLLLERHGELRLELHLRN